MRREIERGGEANKQTNKPADRDATNKKAITPLT